MLRIWYLFFDLGFTLARLLAFINTNSVVKILLFKVCNRLESNIQVNTTLLFSGLVVAKKYYDLLN